MAEKRVVAFLGSPRRKQTHKILEQLGQLIVASGDVEIEYVFLRDYELGTCLGCFMCLTKGEEFCPLKDDRDLLVEKIESADGIIFATPNYALQVTALMKNMLDRLAYVFHRPRFFHKAFMAVVTQGVYGGEKVVKYLEEVAGFWGFNVARGLCVTTLDKRTATEQATIDTRTREAADRFVATLRGDPSPRPTLFRTIIFRMSRSSFRAVLDESSRDYRYFRDMGWFTSDYYYKTDIGLIQRILGTLADSFAEKSARRRAATLGGNS